MPDLTQRRSKRSTARSCRIQAIINRRFPPQTHPNRIFEQTLFDHLEPGDTVLDIGCGRRAPNLIKLSRRNNFMICKFEYIGQYPSSFRFSEFLFRLASRYERFLEHRSLHCLRGWILCILCKPA